MKNITSRFEKKALKKCAILIAVLMAVSIVTGIISSVVASQSIAAVFAPTRLLGDVLIGAVIGYFVFLRKHKVKPAQPAA